MDFHPMPRYIMRKHAIKKILKQLKSRGLDLLEIGYGAGDIFNEYLQLGINCYGYDFSEEAYNYANEKYLNRITLFKNESEIKTKKFDIVVACEVLEHIENDLKALIDWNSYLKDNGLLLISVPAHIERWDFNDIYSGHYRRYEKKELIQLLKKAGYETNILYTYDFPSCFILDPIRSKSAKQINSVPLNRELSKEELTKISGIRRDQNRFFRLLSNKILLFPLIKFQELFYKTDWGSAFILLCKKTKEEI